MDFFTQRVLDARTSTHLLAATVRRQVDNTIGQWRLTVKEDTHDTNTRVDLMVPPSPPETSSCDDVSVPEKCKLERAHMCGKKRKSRREKTDRLVLFFSTRSCLLRTQLSDMESSANRKERHRNKERS